MPLDENNKKILNKQKENLEEWYRYLKNARNEEDQATEVCYLLDGLLPYLEDDKALCKSIDLHNECSDSYISDWYLDWFNDLSEDEQRDVDPELYAETQEWNAQVTANSTIN